eukprot:g24529.t1
MEAKASKTAKHTFLMRQKKLAQALGIKDLPKGQEDGKARPFEELCQKLGQALDATDFDALKRADPFERKTADQITLRNSTLDVEAQKVHLQATQAWQARKELLFARAEERNKQESQNAAPAKSGKRKRDKRSRRTARNRRRRNSAHVDSVVAMLNIDPREPNETAEAFQTRADDYPTSAWTLGVVVAKDPKGQAEPQLKLQVLGTSDNDLIKGQYGFAEEEEQGVWVYHAGMALEDAQEKLTAEAGWYDYEWEVIALQVELSEGHTGSILYSDQQVMKRICLKNGFKQRFTWAKASAKSRSKKRKGQLPS